MGLSPNKAEYTAQFSVLDNECDMHGLLTPGGIMRMCQQVSTDHCTLVGMDTAFYDHTNTAFLMARVAFQWHRIPHIGETLTLQTLPEKSKHAMFKRITRVYDETHICIGMMDSRWILVDSATWRVLRHMPESYDWVPFADHVEGEVDFATPRKVDKDTLEQVCTTHASYSLCDIYHHINNTRYADIACDALPPNELRNAAPQRWAITYRKELTYGTTFHLSRMRMENKTWYVAGFADGEKPNFEAMLELTSL